MRVIAALLLAASLMAGCNSVKVQTGPATEEVRTERSNSTASGLRANFARNLEQAAQADKGLILRNFMDSASHRILGFGQQVAGEWHSGNRGRGEEISADEMRTVIDNTIRTERPVLDSYEDIIDYGISHLEEQRSYDDRVVEQFRQLRRRYEGIYSSVFFPNGTVADYEDTLTDQQLQLDSELRELDQTLATFR